MSLVDEGVFVPALSSSLHAELRDSYNEVVRNYREHRWEPSELNGGKLCEVVYSILRGHVDGAFPVTASKPRNMVDACREFEKLPRDDFPQTVRITIPRMLIALYEIRNNRGVGHVGGDVNANHMDATVVLGMSKWIMAELVRLFHAVSVPQATSIVDALSDRTVPIVWEVNGKRRILTTSLSTRDATLLLLYSSPEGASVDDLLSWTEYANPSRFRNGVIRGLHRERLVEYDRATEFVKLSPTGIAYVEASLPLDSMSL